VLCILIHKYLILTASSQPTALILEESTLNRSIIKLAAPAIVENLLTTAVFFVNTLLLGRLRDPAALAAVGVGNTYQFIAQGMFMAVGIAALALVARAWGAQDFVGARRTAAQATTLTVLLSVIVVVPMWVLAEVFTSALAQDPDPVQRARVISQSVDFTRIILLGAPLAFARIVLNALMRATGDGRTPMLITLLVNVLNIALAVLLIFGAGPLPALGIRGAALAIMLSQALGGAVSFVVCMSGRVQPQLRLSELLAWDTDLVRRLIRVGLPNIAENAVQRVGFVTFMGIVGSLGTAAMAAHQITNSIEIMAFMPAQGLATAVSTLVGQALGARQARLAELAVRRTTVFGIAAMLIAGALFVLFGARLAALFGAEQEVLALASMAVRISALELPTLALYFIYSAALRGAGDTRSPMIVSLLGAIVFRVSAVWLLAIYFGLGLAGVWYGTAIDWLGRAVVVWVLYRNGRWKR
jgi:putative MATE family efflux protein